MLLEGGPVAQESEHGESGGHSDYDESLQDFPPANPAVDSPPDTHLICQKTEEGMEAPGMYCVRASSV